MKLSKVPKSRKSPPFRSRYSTAVFPVCSFRVLAAEMKGAASVGIVVMKAIFRGFILESLGGNHDFGRSFRYKASFRFDRCNLGDAKNGFCYSNFYVVHGFDVCFC